jgi:hypothetical protein
MIDVGALWKIIVIVLAGVIGSVSVLVFHGKKNNPIEQISEAVIQMETGAQIDLSASNTNGNK